MQPYIGLIELLSHLLQAQKFSLYCFLFQTFSWSTCISPPVVVKSKIILESFQEMIPPNHQFFSFLVVFDCQANKCHLIWFMSQIILSVLDVDITSKFFLSDDLEQPSHDAFNFLDINLFLFIVSKVVVLLSNQGQWPDSFCDLFVVMNVAFSNSNGFLLMDVEEDVL